MFWNSCIGRLSTKGEQMSLRGDSVDALHQPVLPCLYDVPCLSRARTPGKRECICKAASESLVIWTGFEAFSGLRKYKALLDFRRGLPSCFLRNVPFIWIPRKILHQKPRLKEDLRSLYSLQPVQHRSSRQYLEQGGCSVTATAS